MTAQMSWRCHQIGTQMLLDRSRHGKQWKKQPDRRNLKWEKLDMQLQKWRGNKRMECYQKDSYLQISSVDKQLRASCKFLVQVQLVVFPPPTQPQNYVGSETVICKQQHILKIYIALWIFLKIQEKNITWTIFSPEHQWITLVSWIEVHHQTWQCLLHNKLLK